MFKTCSFHAKQTIITSASIALSISLNAMCEVTAAPAAQKQSKPSMEEKSTKIEANKQSVQKTTDKRKEIVAEAVSTIRETQDALKALDEGKNKEALAGLERATGKLEIVLARDPKVALVPLDVKVETKSIVGSIDTIKKARQEAQTLLANGRVQESRRILDNLCSETVISTTNIPMATYPGALKQAAKLIDENKANEAKEVLQRALSTLVITDVVVPLPVMEAKVSLQKAEEIAKIKSRTPEQNRQLSVLVNVADSDIQLAEALGYGTKNNFDSFHKQVSEIRQKTSNGKFGVGFFDQIKSYIESMNKSSQHPVVPVKSANK